MTVNIFSPSFDPCDSYGRLACELSRGLRAAGQHTNCFGADAPEQMIRPALGGFVLGYPTAEYGSLAHMGPRVAVTMFEATSVPPGWVAALNSMDAVIVPSTFVRAVFMNCGVQVPVHVVPLGVSEVFKQPRPRQYSDPFTVLVFADRGTRKLWWEAILAFHRAFGDDERYRLIVKSRKEVIRVNNPNVEVRHGDLTTEQLRDLYNEAHVLLYPGREGFGLPPREMAATGGVALSLDWGGTEDGLAEWGVAIPRDGYDVAFPDHPDFGGGVGFWGSTSIEAMVKVLQTVEGYYEHYAAQAMDAATWVRDTYRWDAFAQRCFEIYERVVEERYARHTG